jgi:uncharacterized protein (DUF362 family)
MSRKRSTPKANTITRREALSLGLGAGLGLLAVGPAALGGAAAPRAGSIARVPAPGIVVRVRMPGMRDGLFPRPDASRRMVDAAVTALAGETDPGRAWLTFVGPSDRVLIKVNCLGTRMASTMREVAFAVADAIRDAGVPDASILVLDMFASNMMGGRYTVQSAPTRMRVLAHADNPYQKALRQTGPARARFSDLLLWSTAVINVPPIKDHDLAGVTCCMKNMAFGTVEKPHLNHAVVNEAIARLWTLEEIRSRVRLNVIDGSTVLFDGGPKFNRAGQVPHECVYATTDPVAMDAVAYELIELLRAENGLKTLAEVHRPPKYLELAAALGLGVADRRFISLETIDLPRYMGPSAAGTEFNPTRKETGHA